MTEHAREPLLPLIVSLIGVSMMITACSVILVPYHAYRWIQRRLGARRSTPAPTGSPWRIRPEPASVAPSPSLPS